MSNSISFMGRVGSDPELKKVGENTVLEFSVADNVGFGDRQVTNWYRCAIWGKRGTSLQPHIMKGGKLFVTGVLTLRKWEKDGVEKISPDVKVEGIEFAGDAKKEGGASAPDDDSDLMPF